MYFLKQIKTQVLLSLVNYQNAPGEGGRGETDIKTSDWFTSLPPEEQEILKGETNEELRKYKEELGKLESSEGIVNPYFNNLDSQEWFKKLSPEQQAEVREIEKEIETVLQPFIDERTQYSNIMIRNLDGISVDETDEDFDNMSMNLMDITSSIAQARARVEELMSKVRNIETGEVQAERYKLVEEEYRTLLESPLLEDSQKHIIGEKVFNELTAGDFYALKKEKPELLGALLLSTVDGNKVTTDMLKTVGTQLRVNFASNSALDQIVGAGDILPMKSVAKVEINGQVGERRGQPRPGFYTQEGGYLAIHDGYKIKILEINELDDTAWTEFMTHVDKRYTDIRGAEVIQGIVEQINADGEKSLEFPQFMSDTDKDLLENYFSGKIPDYMQESVSFGINENQVPNISISEPYTKQELSSVLDEYKNIKSGISEYFSENESLLDQKTVTISLEDFKSKTGITTFNSDFIVATFQSMLRDESDTPVINVTSSTVGISSEKTMREVFAFGGGNQDLREYSHLHPREASLKNNNPSGLTYNNTFMRTLTRNGIIAERGTARPAREGGHYFGFPNIGEGIKAHNLLWDIKIRKQSDNTLGALLGTWAVDISSYRSQLGQYWNMKVGDIVQNEPEIFHEIQMKQLRIESPGMYSILQQKDLLDSYHTIRA